MTGPSDDQNPYTDNWADKPQPSITRLMLPLAISGLIILAGVLVWHGVTQ